jgi:hypothetical protein
VDSSTARIYPEDMFKAEVFAKSTIYHTNSKNHKPPTLGAYVGFLTAVSDVVIVGQVDIKT